MYGVEFKNYMETCVDHLMDSTLANLKCCKCEACKADIKAIALNDLPPKYVVTRKGQLYTKLISLQLQFEIDIVAAISKAAKIVGSRPRHENLEQ